MIPAPAEVGPVHFVGVGGIGMSGIAEVLRNLGYEVQGSDLRESARTGELRRLGIPVAIGHAADNLGGARAVVRSSAVPADNPELAAARERGIPVVGRAEMLAELMRFKRNIAVSGTHGKTTTTSLIAAILDAAHLSPTVINGGVIRRYGSTARLGDGAWMVVEADESDGSFLRLPPTVGVVTNIDPEHLDHYPDFDAIRSAFARFVDSIPFYGCAVCCVDHPVAWAVCQRASGRRVVGYGFGEAASVRATNLRPGEGGVRFDVGIRELAGAERQITDVFVPMPGRHNVQNALAAVATGLEIGIPDAVIPVALAEFDGVGRRFSHVGEVDGITIVDDYAHHPVEIAATLAAAREVTAGRILAVHQPHRFSRLSTLFDDFCACFDGADTVAIAEVYAAGESPVPGYDSARLLAGIEARGTVRALALDSPGDLPALVRDEARAGDLVLCLGAGTITAWAAALPAELAALSAGG